MNGFSLAGSEMYPWAAFSPSDPSKRMLGFDTKDEASAHQLTMNTLLEQYENDGLWNKEYWSVKPQPWQIVQLPNTTN